MDHPQAEDQAAEDQAAEDQARAEAEPTADQSALDELARAVQESLDRRDNGGPPAMTEGDGPPPQGPGR